MRIALALLIAGLGFPAAAAAQEKPAPDKSADWDPVQWDFGSGALLFTGLFESLGQIPPASRPGIPIPTRVLVQTLGDRPRIELHGGVRSAEEFTTVVTLLRKMPFVREIPAPTVEPTETGARVELTLLLKGDIHVRRPRVKDTFERRYWRTSARSAVFRAARKARIPPKEYTVTAGRDELHRELGCRDREFLVEGKRGETWKALQVMIASLEPQSSLLRVSRLEISPAEPDAAAAEGDEPVADDDAEASEPPDGEAGNGPSAGGDDEASDVGWTWKLTVVQRIAL